MSLDILKERNVLIVEEARDWQDAIRMSVAPLETQCYVKPCYKEEIIANTKELGAYYMIAPQVVMPHARPEQGVNDTQLSVTLFRKPVYFPEKEEGARLFIVLAAKDNDSHIDAMTLIMEALEDDEKIGKLCSAESKEELYRLLSK